MAQWLPMRSLKKESGSSTLPLPGLIFPTIRKRIRLICGLEVKGGAFLIDNVALLLDAGATWQGGGTDVYTLGVGGRYYFNKIGVFLGADVNLNRYNWDGGDKTRFGFGMEGGYAFFLSRTVTIEPAVYWDINKDRSEFGLKVGFGFYF